jgi:hypothetical protein
MNLWLLNDASSGKAGIEMKVEQAIDRGEEQAYTTAAFERPVYAHISEVVEQFLRVQHGHQKLIETKKC